ncbi:MAG: hypothetical protein KA781_10190 [Aquabacterium sp.]|nr:hypothetical protein [Aquabacterium sp.]
MTTLNPSWWAPAIARKAAPVDHLEQAIVDLRAGLALDRQAGAWLLNGLEKYRSGTEPDLLRGLGLKATRGGRHTAPLAVERRIRRDALIRKVALAQPEPTATGRAKATAALLSQPADQWRKDLTEGDLVRYLTQLHEQFGTALPTTWRRIYDIAAEIK